MQSVVAIPIPVRRKRHYRKYHTNVKLFISQGGDSHELKFFIPKSTLHRFRQASSSEFLDLDSAPSVFKNLVLAFRSDTLKYYHRIASSVSAMYRSMLFSLNKGKEVFEQSKPFILKKINDIRDSISLKYALELFDLPPSRFFSWMNDKPCLNTISGLCARRFPNQLLHHEVHLIEKYLSNPQFSHWPLISVFYQGVRDRIFHFNHATFYKYARMIGIERFKPKHRRKNHHQGVRASLPNEIWHADTTRYRTVNNVLIWLYFITDNFSRFILGWKASLECSAKIHHELLKEVFEKYVKPGSRFPLIQYMTDDGSENKGEVKQFIESHEDQIQRIIAQIDVSWSNSMAEAVNKQMKYNYLFRKDLFGLEDTIQYLEFAVNEHNYVKPHGELKSLTPFEAYSCLEPDWNKQKILLENARQKRIEEHQKIICQNHDETRKWDLS
ncbi:MAG: DDE-type integrase/transposase/recombinase [Candidatus Aureabacteria bacterium]|nr:DDE-type integrase/transposase/recombinase [Candidatus Auribacterota bacterium]